ncbi:glycosyltransferase family 4 protein [Pseudomonas sp. LRF_L74]|uniref:glycosyltransferase family 4 protein n=1 Tax=Pseudomonas sp. LRF_L74 TaxID=3369422 RepID=UPI003F639996
MSLRVLQVSKEFHPLSSGVARHIQGLVQALGEDRAFRFRVLAPTVDATSAPCAVVQGRYSALWRSLADCDVVHVHGARTPFVAFAALSAWLRGVPVVYTPHCYYDTGSPWRRRLKRLWDLTVERALVRSAGAVILLHEGWIDDLAARGLHPPRLLIVPNCIDARRHDGHADEERLEGKPALLSIGRLDPVKRLDDVVQALAQRPLAEAVLHIIGQGEDRARLEALAAQLDVAGRVRFHGWQDDESSSRMMAGCDAMVLASAREGMPTVVLEALLAGVPIACSDIEGNRAILHAVGWDAMYPVGEVPALAACAFDTAQRQVPQHVRDAVHAQFTWRGQAPRLTSLYAELTSHS